MEAGEIQVLHYARNTPAYTYNYTYDVNKDNVNGRTIMGFSTNALDEMWNCTTCPYETFNKYVNYYGMPDYGHRLILAALDGARTKFQNGNLDFSEEKRPVRAGELRIEVKNCFDFQRYFLTNHSYADRDGENCYQIYERLDVYN